MATGRPSEYTPEIGLRICERIAAGESLRRICEADDLPTRQTVHNWLLDADKAAFFDQYKKACDTRAENMFDELLEIADDGTNDYYEKQIGGEDGVTVEVPDTEHIQRSRLRVDTRKWYLSKVLPKKYGEKTELDLTSGGKPIAGFNFLRNGDANTDNTADS